MNPVVLRYSAFTLDPTGGNPAGVVLDARGILEVMASTACRDAKSCQSIKRAFNQSPNCVPTFALTLFSCS